MFAIIQAFNRSEKAMRRNKPPRRSVNAMAGLGYNLQICVGFASKCRLPDFTAQGKLCIMEQRRDNSVRFPDK